MKVVITAEARAKLEVYVHSVDGEISGYGKVSQSGDTFTVTDVVIVKQTCSGAGTEIDGDAAARFIEELLLRGENPADYRLWWHSHGKMDTFWSTTDEDNISNTAADWSLSLVVNKKGAMKARLDVFRPCHLYLDNVEISVDYQLAPDVVAQLQAEVTEKVTEAPTTMLGTTPYMGKSFFGDEFLSPEEEELLAKKPGGAEGGDEDGGAEEDDCFDYYDSLGDRDIRNRYMHI